VNSCLRTGFFCLALLPAAARAELFGYIDEQGQAHFAHEQLDGRYQPFVKEENTAEFEQAIERQYFPPTELKYFSGTDKLEDHILYKRIQKTPNVAKYETMVLKEARLQKLDPALVKAVIAVESAYDPAAVSAKGAIGLMQLIPETAARYGVRLIADPRANINGGTRYLKDLITMFGGNLSLALAGYNAGEGAVRQHNNAIPPFPETVQYVKLVMQFYDYFGGRPGRVTRSADGRVHVTLPGRRNLPAAPGVSALADLARDPRARGLFTAPALAGAPSMVPVPAGAVAPSAAPALEGQASAPEAAPAP
jgi:hypothetical protein